MRPRARCIIPRRVKKKIFYFLNPVFGAKTNYAPFELLRIRRYYWREYGIDDAYLKRISADQLAEARELLFQDVRPALHEYGKNPLVSRITEVRYLTYSEGIYSAFRNALHFAQMRDAGLLHEVWVMIRRDVPDKPLNTKALYTHINQLMDGIEQLAQAHLEKRHRGKPKQEAIVGKKMARFTAAFDAAFKKFEGGVILPLERKYMTAIS
jgi:hypothetical protein